MKESNITVPTLITCFFFFSKNLYFTRDDFKFWCWFSRRSSAPLSTSHHDFMRKITELINIFPLDSPQVSLVCCNVNKIPITALITRTQRTAPQKLSECSISSQRSIAKTINYWFYLDMTKIQHHILFLVKGEAASAPLRTDRSPANWYGWGEHLHYQLNSSTVH